MKTQERFFSTISFVFPLLLYITTICPTVHLGDSGELNLAAATLGIPHVPGYPLLAQAGHLVCQLPFGNGAFRGNLFSALSGALACLLFFKLLTRKFGRPGVAFAFSMALAASFTLWEQSLKIRAYPLNTCFAILTILLAVMWQEKHDRRILFAMALLFGIGLGNHEILLITAMTPLVVFAADWRSLKVGHILGACFFGLLGLTIYLYLPVRASADPVLNWGNPDTLSRFLDVIFQRQYAGKMFNPDWGPKLEMIGVILKAFTTEFGPIIAILGTFGIFFAFKKDRALAVGLTLTIVANIAIRINYIGEHEFHQILRYMITSFAIFLLFAAYLVDIVLKALEKSTFSALFKGVLVALALVAIATPPMAIHGARNDLSNHGIGYDFIQASLMFPEPDYSIAVGGDNNVFPMWYLQDFERFREDVVVLPSQGFRAQWLADQIAAKLPEGMTDPKIRYIDLGIDQRFYSTLDRLNWSRQPVYSLFETVGDVPGQAAMQDLTERYELSLCGVAFRFGPQPPYCQPNSRLWELYPLDRMADPTNYHDFHTTDLLENVAIMLTKRGAVLSERKEWLPAIRSLELATLILPKDPWPWMNLANALAKAGDTKTALEIYKRLAAEDPDNRVLKFNYDLIRKVVEESKDKP